MEEKLLIAFIVLLAILMGVLAVYTGLGMYM